MDYPLEFITWLENHNDLCEEQFHIAVIAEYLKGHVEWYDVMLFHMESEGYDGEYESGYWGREFNRRVDLLYEMFVSGIHLNLMNTK